MNSLTLKYIASFNDILEDFLLKNRVKPKTQRERIRNRTKHELFKVYSTQTRHIKTINNVNPT